jgi:hypothetical protein
LQIISVAALRQRQYADRQEQTSRKQCIMVSAKVLPRYGIPWQHLCGVAKTAKFISGLQRRRCHYSQRKPAKHKNTPWLLG